MSQSKQMLAGLLALGASFSLPLLANAGESTDTPFKIMNAGEVATHTAAMKALEGAAREDYRNALYAQLKERAARNGYRLPDAPPWASAGGPESHEATDAVAGPSSGSPAEARHAELREKLEASRAVAERATEANLQQFAPVDSTEPVETKAAAVSPEPVVSDQAGAAPEPAPAPATSGAIAPSPPAMAQTPEAPPVPDQPVATESSTGAPPALQGTVVPVPAARGLAGYGSYTTPTPPTPPAPPQAPDRVFPDSPQAPAAEPPRFVPPEVAAEAQAIAPSEPKAVAAGNGEVVPPAEAAEPAAPPAMPAAAEATPTAVLPAPPTAPPAPAYSALPEAGDRGQESTSGYREQMRTRFDEYMMERQAQLEEKARRQREQHEANMARNRAARPGFTQIPAPAPAYPSGPTYGPRYPAAYPGYRTPYWQQP
jgi:hypothetical protein